MSEEVSLTEFELLLALIYAARDARQVSAFADKADELVRIFENLQTSEPSASSKLAAQMYKSLRQRMHELEEAANVSDDLRLVRQKMERVWHMMNPEHKKQAQGKTSVFDPAKTILIGAAAAGFASAVAGFSIATEKVQYETV